MSNLAIDTFEVCISPVMNNMESITPGTDATSMMNRRNGRIARLPRELRTQVNRLLEIAEIQRSSK